MFHGSGVRDPHALLSASHPAFCGTQLTAVPLSSSPSRRIGSDSVWLMFMLSLALSLSLSLAQGVVAELSTEPTELDLSRLRYGCSSCDYLIQTRGGVRGEMGGGEKTTNEWRHKTDRERRERD